MEGRTEEIEFLNERYNSKNNNFIMIYGRTGIGKTELICEFVKDKSCIYYAMKECSETEQINLMKNEFMNIYGVQICGNTYSQILSSVIEKKEDDSKLIFVFDEVQFAIRQGIFGEEINMFLKEMSCRHDIMIIFTSSSVSWVENNMISDMKEAACFTGILKVEELKFSEISNVCGVMSDEEAVYVYGILGGVPEYLKLWDTNSSLKDNVIRLFLKKTSPLYNGPANFLKNELRELAAYNTILYKLACGNNKMNDLHKCTGYSRSKLSVYLKNLAGTSVVNRVLGYEPPNKESICKGIYDIKDNMICFWYRFVFPNKSLLETNNAEYVYDKMIEPYLDELVKKSYIKMSKELLSNMSENDELPVNYNYAEIIYSKMGGKYIVVTDTDNDSILVADCMWNDRQYIESDYEKIKDVLKKSGLEADHICLFSRAGFSFDFISKYAAEENLTLVPMT